MRNRRFIDDGDLYVILLARGREHRAWCMLTTVLIGITGFLIFWVLLPWEYALLPASLVFILPSELYMEKRVYDRTKQILASGLLRDYLLSGVPMGQVAEELEKGLLAGRRARKLVLGALGLILCMLAFWEGSNWIAGFFLLSFLVMNPVLHLTIGRPTDRFSRQPSVGMLAAVKSAAGTESDEPTGGEFDGLEKPDWEKFVALLERAIGVGGSE